MIKLTARQQQILVLIQKEIEESGFPPTRAEIARELGFRSENAAEEHLQALARKGMIEILPGISRGIRLMHPEHIRRGNSLDKPAARNDDSYELPLLGRVAAGSPLLAQEHIENKYRVDAGLFVEKPDYLLRVRGLSMQDVGILEGDMIAVKKTAQAKNGQIIVARIDQEVTVKRFKKTGALIELISENPNFAPIRVKENSGDFVIEGRVVGLIRDWS